MSFIYEFEGLEVETEDGEFLYCYGNVEYELEDNSFDYAGTHCTHGQGGTHDPGDSAEIHTTNIDEVTDENGKKVKHTKEIHALVLSTLEGMCYNMDTSVLVDHAHKQIEAAKESQAIDNYEAKEYDNKRHDRHIF